MTVLPPTVLEAFGADGEPEPLAGGQGTTIRAGRIVLKPADDAEEAEWIAGLFERLEGPGFRVPRPVRTRAGPWLCERWVAWEFLDAQHAGPNGGRWPETIAACRAFHAAIAKEPEPAFIRRASHAWADADRLAWGELAMEPLEPFAQTIRRLDSLLRPVDLPRQAIHGDFTANVLFAEGQPPCVIDFSPYWRPAGFAQAVVICDAISWTGAPGSLVELCADVREFRQLFARAVLRRVWELDQHTRRGRVFSKEHLAEYLAAVGLAERLN
jgi:uncharacterized protein (TIGR02569 family)